MTEHRDQTLMESADAAATRLRAATAGYTWYHKIDLGLGVVTPGLDLDPIWNAIRRSRGYLDYAGKRVLDVACFDGMWAFEAERLGAGAVVATDCNYPAFQNFLFCRQQLESAVIPYFNVSPYNLSERLDACFQVLYGRPEPRPCLFDIVQYLGLLYHVRDPLYCLAQARSVTRTHGHLLLETAAVVDDRGSFMLFNGVPPARGRIYDDLTTWWAPSVPCLLEMLRASLFEPLSETITILPQSGAIARVTLVARAIDAAAVPAEYFEELSRGYRNPGLDVRSTD